MKPNSLLLIKIALVALDSIREANHSNPFISKSEAFKFWNEVNK